MKDVVERDMCIALGFSDVAVSRDTSCGASMVLSLSAWLVAVCLCSFSCLCILFVSVDPLVMASSFCAPSDARRKFASDGAENELAITNRSTLRNKMHKQE